MKTLHTLIIIIIVMMHYTLTVRAQFPGSKFRSFDELMEALTEEKENTEEDASWIEELEELHEHPVPINTATLEELLKIPLLNEATAEAIIQYRKKTGNLFSVYELASVPGLGRDLAEKISFFVQVGDQWLLTGTDSVKRRKSHHQWLARSSVILPMSAGYRSEEEKPPAYAGSPVKLYTRYQMEIPGFMEAGFTGDKDPGEPFFNANNKKGFDSYSGYVKCRISERIPSFILGDFIAGAGQGLVLWQGFSMGKTAEVMMVSKNNSRIRPFTSSDENRFFRGIATTLKIKKTALNIFFSSKKSDGNISMAEDSTESFTSFQTSGYHRTTSEIEDRKSVRHTVTGILGNTVIEHLKLGVTALYERFELPFDPGDQQYERFMLKGKENFNIGSDYRWVKGKYQFFGEAALSRSLGKAIIQGTEARLHDQLYLTLLFRHFDKNYHATWANAFAGNAKANNESGIFTGIKILPAPGITLSAYIDWYKSNWIKYTTMSPSQGSTSMIQGKFQLSGHLNVTIRINSKLSDVKLSSGNLYLNGKAERNNLRLHTIWDLNDQWSFRTRAEVVLFGSQKPEKGILLYHDIAWSPQRIPVTGSFRLAWFSASSYNTRLYAYENDLLNAFSFPGLSGKGIRTYINLHWKITGEADLWFKAAVTHYPQQEKMDSGNGETDGKCETELKIQIRYRF